MLHTLTMVAREVGIPRVTFRNWVVHRKVIPGPNVFEGTRMYYDDEQVRRVLTTVEALRGRGMLWARRGRPPKAS
jgi:hypothetical protein